MALKAVSAILACFLTAGCVAGPDFTRPAAPDVASYTASDPSSTVASDVHGGGAQRFVQGADIAGDWWTLFHSQPLDDLIRQALADNHDLRAAQAALKAARENVLARRGASLPTISASLAAIRSRQSLSISPTPADNTSEYSLFTPEVSVAYTPDVFGLIRRTTESVKAQEDSARYQMIAADITLTSNVVAAAIQSASVRAQIDATRQLADVDRQMVDILKYQLSKGYANQLDLSAQEVQLAQLEGTLPPLLKQAAQEHDLLAVLAGRFPSQAPTDSFDLAGLTLPDDLPVSLPSKLVEQRPDVLQAEANMHLASAQVGIAAASRLPNIQLTADAGSMALALDQVFARGNGFWDLGAAATAPIFDGGTLLHQERAAKAVYEQASEQYRSAVLTAFQNVADTLTALDQDAAGLKAAAAAEAASKVTLDLSQRQWRDGYASYLSVLTAEQAYQQARIALVQAQANRFTDTAALFQALGGGWWRTDLAREANAN